MVPTWGAVAAEVLRSSGKGWGWGSGGACAGMVGVMGAPGGQWGCDRGGAAAVTWCGGHRLTWAEVGHSGWSELYPHIQCSSCLSCGQTGPCCTVTVPPPKVPSVCLFLSLLWSTSPASASWGPPASGPLNVQVPSGCILLPAPAPHDCLHTCALGSLALVPAFEVSTCPRSHSGSTLGLGFDPGAPASPNVQLTRPHLPPGASATLPLRVIWL